MRRRGHGRALVRAAAGGDRDDGDDRRQRDRRAGSDQDPRAGLWLGSIGETLPRTVARSLKSDQETRNSDATDTTIIVCKLAELPAGEMRLIEADGRKIGVFHCADGELYAIEDRCSHDDGPLAEGEFDAASCTVECPRHGSLFDIRTGKPQTLPAYRPVDTFEVRVDDDEVKLEL